MTVHRSDRLRWTLREGERVPLPRGQEQKLIAHLMAGTASYPFDVFLQDRLGLRVGNVVGAIHTDALSIEILPKIRSADTGAEDRRILHSLLSECLGGRWSLADGFVSDDQEEFFEPVIHAFALRLVERLGRGAPRRYEPVSERTATLRGTIDFATLSRMLPPDRIRLPLRHVPLQVDNPLTHLIKGLAAALQYIARSESTKRLLRQIGTMLSAVDPAPLTREHVDRVRLSRYEAEWTDVLLLAKALVRGQTASPFSPGALPLFSILFSMSELFETLVRKRLREALAGSAFRLVTHWEPRHLLQSATTDRSHVNLRPDFLVASSTDEQDLALVADAKWKFVRQGVGLERSDVYQLAAYMLAWRLGAGVLFFPLRANDQADIRSFSVAGSGGMISLCSVDVAALLEVDGLRRLELEHLRRAIERTLADWH